MPESTNVDAVMVGVLYWPIYLEMQRRRLKIVVKRQAVSQLPEVDFVEVMKKLGLFVPEGSLATLRDFDEPEELVSRHGNRLWYWVQDMEGTSRLLLVCLIDKQTAEAIEILVMDFEDRWYLEDAALRLNKGMDSYSIDVLHRVVQHWVFLHDGLKITAWQSFTEIAKSLKEFLEFIKASKQQTTSPVDDSNASRIEETASLATAAEMNQKAGGAVDVEVLDVAEDEAAVEVSEQEEAIEESESEETEMTASAMEETDANVEASSSTDEVQGDGDDELSEADADDTDLDLQDESSKPVLRPDFSQAAHEDSAEASPSPTGTTPAAKKRRSAW
jgi:hypothetical protein